ncbi:hypothetical protein VNI00_014080 [Paramarasmius palmivorus]|uniref:Uncharacterized protein n=1 Tax=Paramarasmius palmivorus TaxID=297713 RepID=A0AAW0BWM5_9AGAR
MPSLPSIRLSNSTIFAAISSKSKSLPVGVFVGGTSGVGQGTAFSFASHTKGNAHIILVGRNEAAANSILKSFPKPSSPDAKHEFIQCDVTMMKNVQKTTDDILSRYPKINYLVMSTGYITSKGRDGTPEGIDKKMAVHYYSRWKFVSDLLPGLLKAKEDGEDARVLSVLTAGRGVGIQSYLDNDDLAMRKSFSQVGFARAGPTYMDLMLEEFAKRNPSIHFVHAHPGWVRTPLLSSSDSFLVRASSPLIFGILSPWLVSNEECGEYMLHGLLSTATESTRAWRVSGYGEDIGTKNYHGTDNARKRLWTHTEEELRRALEHA